MALVVRGTTMLHGRRAETAALDALVADAAAGRGGALRLEGLPGVGKTALLDDATRDRDGLAVLRAQPAEVEADMPWAGLEPLLGALGVAGSGDGPDQDPAALLRALAARLADAAPVLLVVDDVQWLDASSRQALAYLARRASHLGYGLLAVWSLRGTEPEPWPGARSLTVADLDRADALALASEQGLAPSVAAAFADAAGGNPLALVEGPRSLTEDERAGRAPLPEPLPAGASLEAATAKRVARLPAATQEALLLAAAGAAAADVAGALEPAEDAGLVVLGGFGPEVRFAHPLVRSAVYHAARPSARRDAHRRIAATSAEPRRSWQLALAAPGPDAAVAGALETVADAARRSGGPGAAATVLERAARLTPDPGHAGARLMAAAAQGLTSGRGAWALGLLDELLPGADPVARADVQALRGMAMYQSGRAGEAAIVLEAEADAIEAADPGRASGLLSHACVARMGPGPVEHILSLSQRALALAPANPLAAVLEAEALVCLGRHAEARAALDALDSVITAWSPTAPGHEVLAIAAMCRIYLEDFDLARTALHRLVDANRAAGAAVPLLLPLAVQSTLAMREGRFADAAACAEEAVAISETGLDGGFTTTLTLAAVAMTAAHSGDEPVARAAAARLLALGAAQGLPVTLACAEQALAILALSRGEAECAVGHLQRAVAHVRTHGTRDPAFMLNHADLVEALIQCGRPEEARAVLASLEADAARTGGAWAAAAVARSRALLGPPDELSAGFTVALGHMEPLGMGLELARTRLAFGTALRRARRPADARVQLEAALAALEACGANLWAERARSELAAAGGPGGGGDLTPRERDVCRLVATGASNREVAATLYLSTRTVEHHLRTAYRKLDLRSRSELAARWQET